MSDIKRKDDRGRFLKEGENQRSDGRYQYQYTGLDKKRHVVYSWRLLPSDKAQTGKKADKSLREKEKEIQKALLEGENAFCGNVTLNEMFDIYIKKKKRKGKSLTHNTISNYATMYNNHIRESFIGKMKIQDIKKTNIVNLYFQLQEKNLSYGTITFYQKVLSAVFNMAVDEEYIARNPTARALDQIEGSQQKRESLTIEQEEALLRYAKKYNYSLYRKLVFLIDTMCRIGEFTGITWNDIDMKEKMISINHQLQYKKYLNEDHCRYRIAPTKGKEVRYIPMTQRLYKILKEMRTYYFITRTDIEVDGVKDFVFLTNNGKLVYGMLSDKNFRGF